MHGGDNTVDGDHVSGIAHVNLFLFAAVEYAVESGGHLLVEAFEHFFLQPMDGPDRAANTEAAVAYCLAHPNWRLSVQTHKYLGIP